jgi:hypothetical protein
LVDCASADAQRVPRARLECGAVGVWGPRALCSSSNSLLSLARSPVHQPLPAVEALHCRRCPGVALAGRLGKPRPYVLMFRTRPPPVDAAGHTYENRAHHLVRGRRQKTCRLRSPAFFRHKQYPGQTGMLAASPLHSGAESQLSASYCFDHASRRHTFQA